MKIGAFRVLLKRKIRKLGFKYLAYFSFTKYEKRKNNTILVYTMGKVASSSIYETMFKEFPFNRSFHIHHLSDFWLQEKLAGTPYAAHNQLLADQYFTYKKDNEGKRLKVISLVRDPISRDLSEFFQNYMKLGYSLDKLKGQEIIDIIRQKGHELCLNWFDSEFNEFLNIDIYSYKFDKEKGYSIYQFDDFDVLILQVEKLSTIATIALSEFFGFKVKRLLVSNETGKKFNLYGDVKKEYSEPVQQLNDIYNSKYCKHFYSDQQREMFKKKWTR